MAQDTVIYSVSTNGLVHRELIASSCLVAMATLAFILRLIARWLKKIPLWWDDCTVTAVLILLYGLFAIQIEDAKYGMGTEITQIPKSNLTIILKMLVAFQILWGTAMSLAKLSYMFFYLRVFHVSPSFRVLTKSCMAIVALWWIANILQIFLICRPLAMNWDPSVKGQCGNRPVTYAIIGAFNIATDITTLVLPVPTVWKLQLPTRAKLAVTGIFCIGLLITIISIIRMQSLIVLDFNKISTSMIDPVFWTVAEPALSVINACLPVIRPVVALILPHNFFGSSRNGKSGESRAFRTIDDGSYPLAPMNAGVNTSEVTSYNLGKQMKGTASSLDSDLQDRVSYENNGPLGHIMVKTDFEIRH